MITLTGLHVYPVKSCRGIDLELASLTAAGLAYDREWMIAEPDGRFLTQREEPSLALIETALDATHLTLRMSGAGSVVVRLDQCGTPVETRLWRDRCRAIDQGEEVARWLSSALGRDARLVRFDPGERRCSDPAWTGDVRSETRFSDGFALLAISLASLQDLNSRLDVPLPMNRFRPNLVLDGLPAYGEDKLQEIGIESIRLRAVKSCTRCVVTTTDQASGQIAGPEPMKTLKSYRWDAELRGVTFGQNMIVLSGAGSTLQVGQSLREFPPATVTGPL